MTVVVYRWLPWVIGALALIDLFVLFRLAYIQGQLRALVAPVGTPRIPLRERAARAMDPKVSALHVPKADEEAAGGDDES